ncbi:LuxR C-terminal-related transcriptional regulator [Nocardia xishanensis]
MASLNPFGYRPGEREDQCCSADAGLHEGVPRGMSEGAHAVRRSEESALRIVIVSPIRLYREGLAAVLSALGGIGEIATCEHPVEGLHLARQLAPHILLLDMSAVNSSASARLYAREFPDTKIVALALPETEQRVVDCAEAGVVAYVPREGSIDDLMATIRHAAQGKTLCSPLIAAGLMRRVAALANENRLRRSRPLLTARESEVADYIALGLSNRAIAARLGIEVCTVKNHVHNILEKLGVTQRADVAEHLRDRTRSLPDNCLPSE